MNENPLASSSSEDASKSTPDVLNEANSEARKPQDVNSRGNSQEFPNRFPDGDYIIVRWAPNEPENPYNWSKGRKAYISMVGMVQVINSTLSSALPAGAVEEIGEHFHITSSQQLTLPISTYLIGYVVGPLVFGPLSETYGRRWVMISSFLTFSVFTMACAVAPNFAALCFFRLICGVAASSPIVVIGGLLADLYADLESRGKVMAIFMASTCWGPTIAPIVSGFIGKVGWQWPFWLGFFFAVATFPVVYSLPETYGPLLLRHKAQRLRKEHPEKTYVAKLDLEPTEIRHIVTRVIYRPISMIIHEGIVSFSCLYLSLIYSIFYMFFEAYPLVFQKMYGLSAGIAGLAFVPIAVGCFFAYIIFRFWDAYLRRAAREKKPWALQDEYQRLPLAFLGGPALSIGVFWLAWSSWPYVHPVVPMMAGIPFGIGFLLIFMALINYLTDAYDIYSASALAATSTTRSIFGAVLPLAAEPMYRRLGIHWATSLLGFASAIMILIPVAFIRIGPYLREHSRFSLELKEIKAREEEEDRREARLSQLSQTSTDAEKQSESQQNDKDLEAGPDTSEEHEKDVEREEATSVERTLSGESGKPRVVETESKTDLSDSGESFISATSSKKNEVSTNDEPSKTGE